MRGKPQYVHRIFVGRDQKLRKAPFSRFPNRSLPLAGLRQSLHNLFSNPRQDCKNGGLRVVGYYFVIIRSGTQEYVH